MVLLVNGQRQTAASLLDHPDVQAAAAAFLARPSLSLPTRDKVIYACQGEEATCSADEDAWLASSDATTCIVLIVVPAAAAPAGMSAAALPSPVPSPSRLARVVHHDEHTPLEPTLADLGSQHLRVWMVGAYDDARGVGREVAARLLGFLHRSEAQLEVELACLGRLNTAGDRSPRATALAVHLGSVQALPAVPEPAQRGPLIPQRMAQWVYSVGSTGSGSAEGSCAGEVDGDASMGGHDGMDGSSDDGGCARLRSVYHAATRQLHLALRQGRPAAGVLAYAARMLELPDELLLLHSSTSPAHEPPHFAADMRAAYEWMLQQAGPVRRVTHRYTWHARAWQLTTACADPKQAAREPAGQQAGACLNQQGVGAIAAAAAAAGATR